MPPGRGQRSTVRPPPARDVEESTDPPERFSPSGPIEAESADHGEQPAPDPTEPTDQPEPVTVDVEPDETGREAESGPDLAGTRPVSLAMAQAPDRAAREKVPPRSVAVAARPAMKQPRVRRSRISRRDLVVLLVIVLLVALVTFDVILWLDRDSAQGS